MAVLIPFLLYGYLPCARLRVLKWRKGSKSVLRNRIQATMDSEIERMLGHSHIVMKKPSEVYRKLAEMKQSGKASFQVVTDFDMTLTKFNENGQRCSSTLSALQMSDRMPEWYRKTSHELFDHFHPIEFDHTMTIAEKIPFMIDWWSQAHDNLVKCKLNIADLETIVRESRIRLRDGCDEFLRFAQENSIPVMIFSAGVTQVIDHVLRQQAHLWPNIKVVSNAMQFDEQGHMIGFEGDIIHTFNKNEGVLEHSSYFKNIADRHNIILMGDAIGDIRMAEGVHNIANLLSIGFLNEREKATERLAQYEDTFDIVLIDDMSMTVPQQIFNYLLC